MSIQDLKDSTLTEIVSQNYVYASILYYFGIKFFEFSDHTLSEVCEKKGIDTSRVVKELSKPVGENLKPDRLSSFPIDLLVEVLKHNHYTYAKKKLPYLSNLVASLDSQHPVERDLKLLFPMFMEDFIKHIYEEEDSFFKYAIELYKAASGKVGFGRLFFLMKNNSVTEFANEHEAHDDVMGGIRKLTDDYRIDKNTSLQLQVIYKELQAFEDELMNHAHAENNILFPKALGLENEMRKVIETSSKLN